MHGPFSADFRWVTLDDWTHGPIRCTDGQAAVFSALWAFKGAKVDGERIMTRTGQDSDRPIGLFKVKTANMGKPEYDGPLHAYRALVKSNRRQGVYWMPCASPDLASSRWFAHPSRSANSRNGHKHKSLSRKAMCVCYGEKVGGDFQRTEGRKGPNQPPRAPVLTTLWHTQNARKPRVPCEVWK
ncbi:MAG TPA: hypothetical protein ACQGQH_00425 [Xylella sp.]